MNPVRRLFANCLSIFRRRPGLFSLPLSNGPSTATVTRYQLKPGFRDEFQAMMREHVFQSLESAGNIMVEAYTEKGNTTIIWLVERWQNNATRLANDKTRSAKLVRDFSRKASAVPVETINIEDLATVTGEMYRQLPSVTDDPFTILLVLRLKKGKAAEFITMNRTALPTILLEPGLIVFQFSQDLSRKNRFLVYKKFRNEEALRRHLKDAAVAPLINFLQQASEQLPYERGYHHLLEFAPRNHGKGI